MEGTETCTEDEVFGACVGSVGPSFDSCLTDADEDCDGAAPSCSGEQAWMRFAGTYGQDFGGHAAFGAEGDVFLAGSAGGSTFLPIPGLEMQAGGENTIFVTHYDRHGEHLWSTLIPGDGFVDGIATDADGHVVVVGEFRVPTDFGDGPMFDEGGYVLELDLDGEPLWSRQWPDAQFSQVEVDQNDGDVLLFGVAATGEVDLGGGPIGGDGGPVLVRLSAAGDFEWAQPDFEGLGGAASLAVGSSGLIGVAGQWEGGALTLAGVDVPTQGAFRGLFWSTYGPTGELERSVGARVNDPFPRAAMAIGPEDQIGFIAHEAVNVPGVCDPEDIFCDEELFYTNFVAVYQADGSHHASIELTGDVDPYDVAFGPDNTIVAVGMYQQGADVGAGPMDADGRDVFVTKLDEDANVVWVRQGQNQAIWALRLDGCEVDPNTGRVLGSALQGGNSAIDFGMGPGGGVSSANDAFVVVLEP
ncbi:hypothetical protein ENSA7_67410 [Enhygromyxa salina]|uniref:Uncharacterized protein n=1 Tax=Enhygromyxa salina TaxID=215803 RepID=A0A2S9XW82_9BACT|nr:hypothetical protein ENSA7_67410 [Enhygromyxa salina]